MERNYKHGQSYNRIYKTYQDMVSRCYYPKKMYYKDYGGRGIRVCDEWLDKEKGFINFYNWAMNNGYDDKLKIDRIDVNGNYEPDNCRWVDDYTQANNTSANHYIEYFEIRKSISEWSQITGINEQTLVSRVNDLKWEINNIFDPVRKMKNRGNNYNQLNKIILCSNIAGAGKDTVADYIVSRYGFKKTSFAEGVYKIAKELFNMEEKDRDLLQKIGMKMREIKENVWIQYTINNVLKIIREKNYPLISDMRFKNEHDVFVKLGFLPIRVVCDRDKAIKRIIKRDGQCDISLLDNASEIETREISMIEIENNGTLEELYGKIDAFMAQYEGMNEKREEYESQLKWLNERV
jgi:dephospho-CoA kinase